MKKNLLIVCAAMMLVFCFSATVTLAKQKDQCIELCTTMSGDYESDCSIVWLGSEGWFQVVNGYRDGQTGVFAWYGAAFVMQFSDECGSFFAGTAKRGFFECSSLNDNFGNTISGKEPPEGFNTYVTRNIDKRNCEEMMREQ